jgi:hypothetical protein
LHNQLINNIMALLPFLSFMASSNHLCDPT